MMCQKVYALMLPAGFLNFHAQKSDGYIRMLVSIESSAEIPDILVVNKLKERLTEHSLHFQSLIESYEAKCNSLGSGLCDAGFQLAGDISEHWRQCGIKDMNLWLYQRRSKTQVRTHPDDTKQRKADIKKFVKHYGPKGYDKLFYATLVSVQCSNGEIQPSRHCQQQWYLALLILKSLGE